MQKSSAFSRKSKTKKRRRNTTEEEDESHFNRPNKRVRKNPKERDDLPDDEENFYRRPEQHRLIRAVEDDDEEEEEEEKEERGENEDQDEDMENDDYNDDKEEDERQLSKELLAQYQRRNHHPLSIADDETRYEVNLADPDSLQAAYAKLSVPTRGHKHPMKMLDLFHRMFCQYQVGNHRDVNDRASFLFQCQQVYDLQVIEKHYANYRKHLENLNTSFANENTLAIQRFNLYNNGANVYTMEEETEEERKAHKTTAALLEEFTTKMNQVRTVLHNFYFMISRSIECSNPKRVIPKKTILDVNNFEALDLSDLTSRGLLVLQIEDLARVRHLGRVGMEVYERISVTYKNRMYFTHSWRKYGTLLSFIQECSNRNDNPSIWKHLIEHPGAFRHIADLLQNMNMPNFPFLQKSRYFTSWRNGIYCDSSNQFFEYGSEEFLMLHDDVVCCKHFDLEFRYNDWMKELHRRVEDQQMCDDFQSEAFMNIPTPHFDKILNDQQFRYYEKMWMYILIGRMLYEVNEHDQWTRALWLYGQGGTGKSLVLDCILNFYDDSDVAYVNNKLEQVFYLDSLYEKFLFVIGDVRKQFGIEEGDLAKLISGEGMNVARKNQRAVNRRFTIPFAVASNEFPEKYRNAGGSFERRVFVMFFSIFVMDPSGALKRLLMQEAAAFRFKVNVAYRWMAAMHGETAVQKIPGLPPRFALWANIAQTETSVLARFMSSEHVVLNPDAAIPWTTFCEAFAMWCRENHETFGKATRDNVTGAIFRSNRIYKLNKCPYRIPGSDANQVGDLLVGVSLKKNPYTMEDLHPMYGFLMKSNLFLTRQPYATSAIPKFVFDAMWQNYLYHLSRNGLQVKTSAEYNDPLVFGALIGINADNEKYLGISCANELARFLLSHPQIRCHPSKSCMEDDIKTLWLAHSPNGLALWNNLLLHCPWVARNAEQKVLFSLEYLTPSSSSSSSALVIPPPPPALNSFLRVRDSSASSSSSASAVSNFPLPSASRSSS
jgi:hypothetical protein